MVLISIYCCKPTSRKCEIGMSWIAPQSSGALWFCLQCGVGWALREGCPDGCLHTAELQGFVSGAERSGSSLEHTPSPLHFNKTNSPLVKMGGWWHRDKGFPYSVTGCVKGWGWGAGLGAFYFSPVDFWILCLESGMGIVTSLHTGMQVDLLQITFILFV